MRLKEYIENLNKLVKDNPDALEYKVVYSTLNDEGNGYGEVYSLPSLGQYEDAEFVYKKHYDEDPEYYDDFKINAACIN